MVRLPEVVQGLLLWPFAAIGQMAIYGATYYWYVWMWPHAETTWERWLVGAMFPVIFFGGWAIFIEIARHLVGNPSSSPAPPAT